MIAAPGIHHALLLAASNASDAKRSLERLPDALVSIGATAISERPTPLAKALSHVGVAHARVDEARHLLGTQAGTLSHAEAAVAELGRSERALALAGSDLRRQQATGQVHPGLAKRAVELAETSIRRAALLAIDLPAAQPSTHALNRTLVDGLTPGAYRNQVLRGEHYFPRVPQ